MAPEDGLDAFRDAVEKSDLAEGLGAIQAAREAGTLGHWMLVWTEKAPGEEDTTHSYYEDAVVGMGLAVYLQEAIARSYQDAEED